MECHDDERQRDAGDDRDDILAYHGREILHCTAGYRRDEVDGRPPQNRAKQHRPAQVAVGAEMDGRKDQYAQQHRMAQGLSNVRAHIRRGKQHERHDHRIGCDGACDGQGSKETRRGIRSAIADDNEHEPNERHEGERASVAAGSKARGERIAQRRRDRHQMDTEKQDEADYE